jgi:hypothetical protein
MARWRTRRSHCSAEFDADLAFLPLSARLLGPPPAAGLRGKRDSYGLDIHLNITMFVDRRPLDFAVDRTPTRAHEGSLPFLGAHEGAMSPRHCVRREHALLARLNLVSPPLQLCCRAKARLEGIVVLGPNTLLFDKCKVRLVQPHDAQQIQLGILGPNPPLKHHAART